MSAGFGEEYFDDRRAQDTEASLELNLLSCSTRHKSRSNTYDVRVVRPNMSCSAAGQMLQYCFVHCTSPARLVCSEHYDTDYGTSQRQQHLNI